MTPKFPFSFRRYRLPILIFNFTIFALFLCVARSAKKLKVEVDVELLQAQDDFGMNNHILTKEMKIIRQAHKKWKECMIEEIEEKKIRLENYDPDDPDFLARQAWFQYKEKEAEKNKEDQDDEFERLWYILEKTTKKCRKRTDIWHIEADQVPGTMLHYLLPANTSTTASVFVRVGLGANVTVEKFFKGKLNANSEFFGADPNYQLNGPVYEEIGTYFPFAVGEKTGRTSAVVRFDRHSKASKVVSHIGIDTFFTNLVKRPVVDYLIFEGEGSEFDMMGHLASNGTLAKEGVTICQMNIELHRPKNVEDTRKDSFKKFIMELIQDDKFTLLHASNVGNLRLFWINTSSHVCAKRYLEHIYSNDVDVL